jgi:hypothetical protein
MKISRQLFPEKTMIDQKPLEKYLGRMLTNYGRCTSKTKSRIVMAKELHPQEEGCFY